MFDVPYVYSFGEHLRIFITERFANGVFGRLRTAGINGRIVDGPRGFSFNHSEPTNLSIIHITNGTIEQVREVLADGLSTNR